MTESVKAKENKASDFTSVSMMLPAPFDKIEVTVNPSSSNSKLIGHSVGVMDQSKGEGMRYFSMEYPEALAITILKATREYRRKNKNLLVSKEPGND